MKRYAAIVNPVTGVYSAHIVPDDVLENMKKDIYAVLYWLSKTYAHRTSYTLIYAESPEDAVQQHKDRFPPLPRRTPAPVLEPVPVA